QMVMDELKRILKKDRAKTTVVGMSGLGLVEVTRKKVSRDYLQVFTDECPYCGGTGKKRGAR
ncbi:MAG: ribonuclease E/G, partial [Clostridiaceae bacterium]|nr:ribonuclease E/G [Clostridiaceae bacterium]